MTIDMDRQQRIICAAMGLCAQIPDETDKETVVDDFVRTPGYECAIYAEWYGTTLFFYADDGKREICRVCLMESGGKAWYAKPKGADVDAFIAALESALRGCGIIGENERLEEDVEMSEEMLE